MHLPSFRLSRLIASAAVTVAGAAALPAVAGADPGAHRGADGYVYVNDNTAGTNTIAGFARAADGGLTPLPGSPFNAGGAGSGSGLASQGAIQVTGDGRFVIAVDAGSSQVSVLRIGPNGDLRLVHGGVVSSGGAQPVSVAEHDGLVYVANAGSANANYTGFTLGADGRLRPLSGSTVTLPSSAQPGDVLFNSTGTNLVGTEIGLSKIDSFSVGSDGRLTSAPDSPFAAEGLGPFGSEFRPTNPSQLFVSNAHNTAPLSGTIAAYSVSSDGTLNSIAGSPFADDQTAPCWIEITRNGEFLFTVNTASGSISRYQIAADGTLTLLGSTPVSNQGGVGAVDARLSADGQSLYVDESRVDSVGVFAVDGGQLTEQATVSLPAGATPAGVAVK
jgi:6-phosphogluconolactonase (cycloisomerase 2 family)